MTIINNKNSYRFILISSFILINLLLVYGLSSIIAFMNSGADRATILHLDKEPINTYLPKIEWEKSKNEGREIEPQTLKTIEKQYLFSWYIRNNALNKNRYSGLADYFTQNSYNQLLKVVNQNKKQKITVDNTTLKHTLKLEFYSEDGQQVVITDKNVVEFQNVYQNKKFIASVKDTSLYKVILLLEDGYWRVRHIVKMTKEPEKKSLKEPGIFTIQNQKIHKSGIPFKIKGINYYPKDSPWDVYGKKYDSTVIKKDFKIIKKANLNTIRIFVPYEDFGKAEIKKDRLQKLIQTIKIAKDNNLFVIVTLFDFYSDYSIESWTLTHRHAEKIITACSELDNILAWDIKNEPNLDFERRKKQNVIPWLENMIDYIKEIDRKHLITIGYSNKESAKILKDKVDFISFHYYEETNDFLKVYNELVKTTKKPVIVGEFGLSSNKNFWNWFGNSKKNQAVYHKVMQEYFKNHDISFVSWTLYDFPTVPDNIFGNKFWIKNKQKNFGFLDKNGNKKPAFLFISH
ncbi:glycosyl hydrolase [Flavobacterium columnare]|uniref:glycosyl hydrolase n=1 Tax=Flavobacterium columnare TaxID=996 RepID=UPI000981BC9F|nr:glycosyl hydrolase [Flavobacterium columnare]OOB83423.1 glycosyl hydrolase family 5 [Flavobacterium columnare]